MAYVNGYAASCPPDKKDAFIESAKKVDGYFKEKGALRVVECWGTDVPRGKQTDFYRAVDANEGEVAVFGWIEWPSKEVADAAMGAMMSDPQFADMEMVINGRKMIFGGFEVVYEI